MAESLTILYSNPWLTWALAWGLWPICWMISEVLTTPFEMAFKAYSRKKRSENILKKGWPTGTFLDADGDIVHPPVKEKN